MWFRSKAPDYFDISQEPRDRKVIEDAVNDILKLNVYDDGDLKYGGNVGPERVWLKGQVISPLCSGKLNETRKTFGDIIRNLPNKKEARNIQVSCFF